MAEDFPVKTEASMLISVSTVAVPAKSLNLYDAVELEIEAVTLSVGYNEAVSTNLLFPCIPGADISASGLDASKVVENVEMAVFMASRAAF